MFDESSSVLTIESFPLFLYFKEEHMSTVRIAPKASQLYTDTLHPVSDEVIKRAIAKRIRPDEDLNTLPPLLTEPKRVLFQSK